MRTYCEKMIVTNVSHRPESDHFWGTTIAPNLCSTKQKAMEAVHQSAEETQVNVSATTPSWIQKLDGQAEFNRYGIISVGFLLVGIVGGITAGFFAFDEIWKLAVVVGFSMLALTLMLATAPMKFVTRSIGLALVVDLLMMIFTSL